MADGRGVGRVRIPRFDLCVSLGEKLFAHVVVVTALVRFALRREVLHKCEVRGGQSRNGASEGEGGKGLHVSFNY